MGYGVEDLLKHSLPQGQPFQEVMRVFLERYEKHLLDKTVLYPSVVAVLDHFHDKHRVVVTNKLHRLAVAIIRGLGVEDRFDAILGGDSVADKKPHPALLHEVLRRFEVPVRRALMVGDGDTEGVAGKRSRRQGKNSKSVQAVQTVQIVQTVIGSDSSDVLNVLNDLNQSAAALIFGTAL